jgi:hypothetical protein
MPINYSGKDLNNLELIKQDSSVLFRLFDNENQNSIEFEYLPKLEEGFNFDNFQLVLFENKYLNAENDVFQVFDKKEEIRLGWIFPLSNLDSNENDYSTNEFLNKYKFVSFQLLLLAKERSIELKNKTNEFKITDLYPNNPIVLILSNENTSKIDNFSIDDYIASLSKFGYYQQNEFPNSLELKPKLEYCLKFRGKQKLNLYKSKRNISDDRFFKELFSKQLKSLDHHLIRFHILYQVIEFILAERFDEEFNNLIVKYSEDNIVKNDFVESIIELRKERISLRKVIELVKQNNCDFDITNLERDCKDLLSLHKKQIRNTLGDLIYDVRNLIVHNYRDIESSEIELIDNITHEFELLIINIIEKYYPQHRI